MIISKNIVVTMFILIMFIILGSCLALLVKYSGLNIDKYIIYILWLIALFLFYIFLPSSSGEIFNVSKLN